MKKVICFLLMVSVCASLFAFPVYAATEEGLPFVGIQEPAAEDGEAADEETLDAETLADVTVEHIDGKVILTVPAGLAGEDVTPDTIKENVKEGGYISGEINDDGSVTYVMTEETHKKFMEEYRKQSDETLSTLVGTDEAPSIVSIEANEDYTVFTVTLNTDTVGIGESIMVFGIYMTAGIYHTFNGTEPENICVQFVNEATGELIQEMNTRDMGSDALVDIQ